MDLGESPRLDIRTCRMVYSHRQTLKEQIAQVSNLSYDRPAVGMSDG